MSLIDEINERLNKIKRSNEPISPKVKPKVKELKVSDFIEFLKRQPQDLTVVYPRPFEYSLLELREIEIGSLCKPRANGFVKAIYETDTDDKPTQEYLILP